MLRAGVRENEFKFRNAELLKLGRTELAEMLKTKDMVDWEAETDAFSEDGMNEQLPSMQSGDGAHLGMRGAKKFDHLGTDVAIKLLDADLNKNEDIGSWAFLVLHAGAGYEIEAFLHKRASSTRPCVCWALASSEGHKDWLETTLTSGLTHKMMNGTLKIPGVDPAET